MAGSGKRRVGRPRKVRHKVRKKKNNSKRNKSSNKVSRQYVKPSSRSGKTLKRSSNTDSSHLTNYNRVRKLLWQRYKGEYTSYREFISSKVDSDGVKIPYSNIISQVLEECRGINCTDDDIISIYISIKRPANKGIEEPIILDRFYNVVENPYWSILNDLPWELFPDNLWVKAPMFFNSPKAFLGELGDSEIEINKSIISKRSKKREVIFGFKTLFRAFVDYCNTLFPPNKATSDEVAHYRFVNPINGTDSPYWNDNEKRWELEIIICDSFGNVDSYGFEPEEGIDLSDSVLNTGTLTKHLGVETTGTSDQSETSTEREKKLEIELEKQKQKTLELEMQLTKSRIMENATKLLLEDKIDKDMFKFIIDNSQK